MVMELLSQLQAAPPETRLVLALFVLLGGYFLSGVISRIIGAKKLRLHGKTALPDSNTIYLSRLVEQSGYVVTIVLALFLINAPILNSFLGSVLSSLPVLLSTLLLLVLGITVIDLLLNFVRSTFSTPPFLAFLEKMKVSSRAMDMIVLGIRWLLYLILIELSAVQLGVDNTLIRNTLSFIAFGVISVLLLLAFFGFKGLVENYAAGFYLKNSRIFRMGEKVRYQDEIGEIRQIGTLNTTIDTASGYFLIVPNKDLVQSPVHLKRTRADINTLSDLKEYFTAQTEAYCGPASAEMALAVFGLAHTQEEIGKASGTRREGGTEPEKMGGAIQRLTKNEVRVAHVPFRKISDLKDELKAWFNDDALVILNFMKPVLFPNATTGHYALCVGVEGSELLVIDPSSKSGGVYYVESKEMEKALGEFNGKSRGYLVLAPSGTVANWRIREGLIYGHRGFYDKLNKGLEMQLSRILRQGRILRSIVPTSVEDFIHAWATNEKIIRLWRPSAKKKSDRKLNDFTRNQSSKYDS